MYEHRSQPLADRRTFLLRWAAHFGLALALVLVSLGAGMAGYHWFARQSWIDAFLNAAMLLGGMGPVGDIATPSGKIFAALFALYAGMLFLVVAGIVMAAPLHRLLHKIHLDDDDSRPRRDRSPKSMERTAP
jgi:hypothetical protein